MKLLIQEAAEQDILRQVEWYAEQGVLAVARRFHAAVVAALDAVLAMPGAGLSRPTGNAALAGLRTWPVKGSDMWRVYYLVGDDLLTVVRVLHDRRDIAAVLGDQFV